MCSSANLEGYTPPVRHLGNRTSGRRRSRVFGGSSGGPPRGGSSSPERDHKSFSPRPEPNYKPLRWFGSRDMANLNDSAVEEDSSPSSTNSQHQSLTTHGTQTQASSPIPSSSITTTTTLTSSFVESFEMGEAVRPAESTVPPDLFKQLNEIGGYTFDESKPPFHSVCIPPPGPKRLICVFLTMVGILN